MVIEPELIVSSRLMQRQSVDLPEPEAPTTTTTSPRAMSRSMSLSASKEPKCLPTWLSRTSGCPDAAGAGWGSARGAWTGI